MMMRVVDGGAGGHDGMMTLVVTIDIRCRLVRSMAALFLYFTPSM